MGIGYLQYRDQGVSITFAPHHSNRALLLESRSWETTFLSEYGDDGLVPRTRPVLGSETWHCAAKYSKAPSISPIRGRKLACSLRHIAVIAIA
jgi:hypothetical protein